MKLLILLLIIVAVCTQCLKENHPAKPQYTQYADFSDIFTSAPIKNLRVDLLRCASTDVVTICNNYQIIGTEITDDKGRIKHTGDSGFSSFFYNASGYFPFDYYGIARIERPDTMTHVKLVPQSFLQVGFSPKINYPAGYKLYFIWYCSYPAGNIVAGDSPFFTGTFADVQSGSFSKTIAGDIGNTLVWTLMDDSSNNIAHDTIKNIVVPRFDTAHIQLFF